MGKERYLKSDEQAAILDLPMYLIIVMIVAIAVIAAIIFMIPKGTQTMNATVTSNFLLNANPGHSGEYRFSSLKDVWIHVATNDENQNPISNALVVLTGANTSDAGKTLDNGSVHLRIRPTIPANINQVYIKMTVKAKGYNDYEDDEAILVNRQ